METCLAHFDIIGWLPSTCLAVKQTAVCCFLSCCVLESKGRFTLLLGRKRNKTVVYIWRLFLCRNPGMNRRSIYTTVLFCFRPDSSVKRLLDRNNYLYFIIFNDMNFIKKHNTILNLIFFLFCFRSEVMSNHSGSDRYNGRRGGTSGRSQWRHLNMQPTTPEKRRRQDASQGRRHFQQEEDFNENHRRKRPDRAGKTTG